MIMKDNQFFHDIGSFSKRTGDSRAVKGQGSLCMVWVLLWHGPGNGEGSREVWERGDQNEALSGGKRGTRDEDANLPDRSSVVPVWPYQHHATFLMISLLSRSFSSEVITGCGLSAVLPALLRNGGEWKQAKKKYSTNKLWKAVKRKQKQGLYGTVRVHHKVLGPVAF